MSESLTWVGEILIVLFALAVVIQFYYLIVELSGVGFKKQKIRSENTTPVSVIICARNESKNLRQFLPSVLEQEYPKFQVVVVNDCSWDESGKYLEEMEDAYSQLKVITLKEQERHPHGKKLALTLGIKGAEYDLLLFTDADCKPVSKDWVKNMAAGFVNEKEIVIGYGAYFKEDGLLNKWIRFDTFYAALFYLGQALKGRAYMATGRNMAYRKQLFFANKGFANHYHIMSGDDDLFINETATTTNTNVEISPESFTYSKPKTSWATWLQQKKRHMSTGFFYKNRDRLFIGAYYSSLTLFYVSAIILIILKLSVLVVVTMFTIRLIMQLVVFGKGMKKLKENDLLWYTPVFDMLSAFIYPLLSVSNIVIKTKTWK